MSHSNTIRRRRRIQVSLAGMVALTVMVYGAGEWYRARDARARFSAMRCELTSVDVASSERRDGHEFDTVVLYSGRGAEATAALKAPVGDGQCYPAFIILGGLRSGFRTIEYLGETRGIVLLALDYPYAGKRERLGTWEFVTALPSMRRAILETVPTVSLGVEYLLSRGDVDPERIVLVGGSLGALFVPAAAVTDERIAAAAMLFGAGDIQRLLRSNMDLPGWAAAPAAWLAAVLTAPVEPLKYVGDIAQRPLLMINGTGDSRMPAECAELLHDRARGDATTIRWIDVEHVNVREKTFHDRVGSVLMDWLIECGYVDLSTGYRDHDCGPSADGHFDDEA